MPKLVIKIVDSGTNHTDQATGKVSPSLTGHMWWELHDNNGQLIGSYGFGPLKPGDPFGPGKLYHDDNIKYDFNPAKGDYQREFEISDSQVKTLKEFGSESFEGKFKFSSTYNGASNSCINYTYKALDMIGFAPKGYDGDVWPTFNIDNIKALPSSNKSDTKIFISNDGGLFFLDDKKQMTIKLFSDANAIDKTKTNSLAINSAKLGSQKTLIKDVNNKKVAEFEVRKGDQTSIFNNSLLLKAEAKFLTKNGEEISQDNAIIKFSDDQLNQLTLIRTDLSATLKDNTNSTLSTILNTIDSASSSLISFINHQIEGIFEPIFKELFSTDESTKDANGDNSAQRLAGKILADLIQGKDITQIANDTTSQILIQNLLKDTSEKLASAIPTGPLKVDTAKFLQGTVAATIINFAIAIAADHRMDSDEYGTASANQNFNYHPKLNFNLKLNFNNKQKPNKKLVANDNYENIFILSLIKNA